VSQASVGNKGKSEADSEAEYVGVADLRFKLMGTDQHRQFSTPAAAKKRRSSATAAQKKLAADRVF